MRRPSPDDLVAARQRTLEDVIAPDLRILFVGINPGLWSGALGFHFAKPGNRFWRAIHLAGLTPTLLNPEHQRDLLLYGIGITNLVNRTTARADELTADELRLGAAGLLAKIKKYNPEKVAFLGLTAYRIAFGQPTATMGRQADQKAWLMPNPSGLNAHYQLADLAEAYSALK